MDSYGILVLSVFLSSVISGMTGMGGGILLLASIGPLFAPSIVIPLHGIIQLSSNISRVALSNRNVQLKVLAVAIPFVFLGTWFGKLLLGKVPEENFKWLIKVGITLLVGRMLLKTVT